MNHPLQIKRNLFSGDHPKIRNGKLWIPVRTDGGGDFNDHRSTYAARLAAVLRLRAPRVHDTHSRRDVGFVWLSFTTEDEAV